MQSVGPILLAPGAQKEPSVPSHIFQHAVSALFFRAGRRSGQAGWRGRGEGVQVAGLHPADYGQMLADAEDEGSGPRAVELWLQKVRVNLLQLVDARDRIEVGA